jgi:hypothetical protein
MTKRIVRVVDVRAFHEPLMAAGLVPQGCKLLDIAIGVSGAFTVTYQVFWTPTDLVRFGQICQQIGAAVIDDDHPPEDDV